MERYFPGEKNGWDASALRKPTRRAGGLHDPIHFTPTHCFATNPAHRSAGGVKRVVRYWHRRLAASGVLFICGCAPIALHTSSLSEPEPPIAEQSIATQAETIFRSPSDLVLGNPSGKISIVEFFDYNCAYCKANVAEVSKLIEADPDVRFVIKEYPILGEGSLFAARAALAADKQGEYREFHMRLSRLRGHANMDSVLKVAEELGLDGEKLKSDMADTAIDKTLEQNKTLARTLSIQGTPTFIVDDSIESRFMSFASLRQKVASIREAGGCKLC
jgi:protein-disulfide isomerase